MYHSICISGLLTLELHAMNNEGTEGNTMMTRMVDIIDQNGQKHTVNAVSGDMFKHMLVEHLLGDAKESGLPLCNGCRVFDANRICSPKENLAKTPGWDEKTLDSVILQAVLKRCVIDDCAGILITGKIGKDRSIARKSCVEFGWVVGRPGATTTESYFHAKYVPEGRAGGSGSGENVGQNIFHRPASSGQYAAVVNIDLYKIGRNDITLEYDLEGGENGEQRRARAQALLRSVMGAFIKPTGAHRNTQNPHIVDFQGVMSASPSTIPAPSISALNPAYREEVTRVAGALNTLSRNGRRIETWNFESLAGFAEKMAELVQSAAS